MRPQPQLSVIVPAYNEEARLGATLVAYLRYFRGRGESFELLVVDDGSLDRTTELVERVATDAPEIRLIRLAENRGKGYAVRSGVVNARGRLVLFADADGATPAEEYQRLHVAIENGADVAIGSRALSDQTVKVRTRVHRRVIGRAFHALVRLCGVHHVADTQCGFKLFRGPVAHSLFSRMRTNGFSFDVEVLLMARLGGFQITEVAVNWVHQPGSRISLVSDSLRMAWELVRIRARHRRGEYRAPHVAPWTAPAPQTPMGAPSS
jgi:dolichyl-phosphate beta-glucosyltransferase